MKPVIRHRKADQDIAQAAEYFGKHGGLRLELEFVEALAAAFGHLSRHPDAGSERYANPLRLEGLRFWPMRKFPYLIFYLDRGDRLEVLRVLHAERDIPAWLQDMN